MATNKSGADAGALAHIVAPGDIELTTEQKAKVSPAGFSQYVRALLQNWRQGTVACKGRSDVAFSNKKPWKQKGTGRARAGSPRSPLWRKGGVIFGPQQRSRVLQVPKALKRQVCASLLWQYLDKKAVITLSWVPEETAPKTAHAYSALKQAGLTGKKITLFVGEHDRHTHASFANIPEVQMLLFDQPNAYDLATTEYWVVLQKDMQAFKEMVNSWI